VDYPVITPLLVQQLCQLPDIAAKQQTLHLRAVLAAFILNGVSNLNASGDPLDDVLDTKLFNDLRRVVTRPDAFDTMYRNFFGNAGKLIGALRDQEGTARRHTLHTLKGSAAMLGAKRLAALAACLQDEDLHSPTLLAEAIEGLETELDSFRRVIAQHVTLDASNRFNPV
jgi:HPt (histidine-containing phosphotransfer) domain-containing protein